MYVHHFPAPRLDEIRKSQHKLNGFTNGSRYLQTKHAFPRGRVNPLELEDEVFNWGADEDEEEERDSSGLWGTEVGYGSKRGRDEREKDDRRELALVLDDMGFGSSDVVAIDTQKKKRIRTRTSALLRKDQLEERSNQWRIESRSWVQKYI